MALRPRRLVAVRAVTGLVSVAVAASVVIGAPAASAEPLIPPNILSTIPQIPFDNELAAGIRMLKAAGVDKMALQAAQVIIKSAGQLSSDSKVASETTLAPNAPGLRPQGLNPQGLNPQGVAPNPVADPLTILKALGIQTLTPSVAPFCTDPTADNPLGLVTAGAGAVAGPWPLASEPKLPIPLPFITLPKLNLVDKGETAFAFVPATVAGGSGGTMQVAWFNTSTLQGGFADLGPLAKDNRLLAALPALSSIRLAPVKTGSGTVLAAVYGTVQNGNRSCFFLPAVGVVEA